MWRLPRALLPAKRNCYGTFARPRGKSPPKVPLPNPQKNLRSPSAGFDLIPQIHFSHQAVLKNSRPEEHLMNSDIQQNLEKVKGYQPLLSSLLEEVSKVVVGQKYMVERLLMGLLL